MKKNFLWASLIVAGFMFMGCPYHSTVSIDTPSVNIDTKLLGKWQKRTSDDETFIITKKDEYNYEILEKEKRAEGSTPKKYDAFISVISGAKFLNLYDESEDSKTYYFYKLAISDETGGFSLSPVTEYITETFTKSDSLKMFFAANSALSFFYETPEEYIKVGK